VIAATHRSLRKMVRQGSFRADLFYRLNVVRLVLPPLRERSEDIPHLLAHALRKHTPAGRESRSFAPDAIARLQAYQWPGNIRELENIVERLSVVGSGPIAATDLPADMIEPTLELAQLTLDLSKPLRTLLKDLTRDLERQYIERALKRTRGHVGKAAKLCGFCRRSLTMKISEYGIDRKALGGS
jgi:DNA-binding NtrC family response regulator